MRLPKILYYYTSIAKSTVLSNLDENIRKNNKPNEFVDIDLTGFSAIIL